MLVFIAAKIFSFSLYKQMSHGLEYDYSFFDHREKVETFPNIFTHSCFIVESDMLV